MSPWGRHRIADRPLTCREVGKLLQSYLDGHTNQQATAKVADHLEDCRRCGLEAGIYREIKASLARQAPILPEITLVRLRRFGDRLVTEGPPPGPSDGDDAGSG